MSTALQRFAAWYLDLPPAGAGQGTRWRLDWGPSVGGEYTTVSLIVVAALAAVLCAVVTLRETATLAARRRLVLLMLRLGVIALLLAMLGRLSVRVDRIELPTVAVLIDTSASMGLVDEYPEPDLNRALRSVAAANANRSVTRLRLAQTLMTQRDGRWLRELERDHRVRLYAFDEHLHALSEIGEDSSSGPTGTTETESRTALITGLKPVGRSTAPARAVRELLGDLRGVSLAAIVVWTDGIASSDTEERLSRGAELARQQGVPLYPIRVGSQVPNRDFELFDLRCPEVANVGETLTVSVRGRSFGLQGQSTEVRLAADGEIIPSATQQVALTDAAGGQALDLTFTPRAEGVLELEVTAAPLTGETDLENNRRRHRVEVRADPLRVLLVEGRPRWEYRALKPVLERDNAIQLHTFLQSADLDYAAEDRTALRSFPATLKELSEYDVIVWGDVDLSELDADVPELLRQHISDQGGGLLLVAGQQHNPRSYGGTSLELLAPVSLVDVSETTALSQPADRLRLRRTLDGEAAPFLRLEDDPAADDLVWSTLPAEIDWGIVPREIKPGASVLATGSGQSGRSELPLIITQHVGQGTVLFHGMDQLWTWRRRVEDRYFGRYWSQAVRRLAAGRRLRDDVGRQLTSDRRVYAPGDEVRLRLRGGVQSIEVAPASVDVTIDSQAGERFQVQLEPVRDVPQLWTGTIRDLPPGDFRASTPSDGVAPGPVCLFRVEPPDEELSQRVAATEDLQQAAKRSHGEYHTFSQADRVPSRLPRGRAVQLTESEPVRLWSRWEMLVLSIGLLTAEWLLRKRARLV